MATAHNRSDAEMLSQSAEPEGLLVAVTVEESTCTAAIMDFSPTTSAPQAGGGSGPEKLSMKECVLKMLDEMDERVDKLKSDALKLESERDTILSTLSTVANAQMIYELGGIDMDEVNKYIDRLASRCLSVEVDVKTERNSNQLEALTNVNSLIDDLIMDLKNDVIGTRRKCIAFINACSEIISPEMSEIDTKFECAVLGCTLDDQKRIKKRLNGLFDYFDSKNETTSVTVLQSASSEQSDFIDQPMGSI